MDENQESDKLDSATASGLRQRWLVNAGLLVFVGALAWLVWHRLDQPARDAGPPLTEVTANAVARIHIDRPDHGVTLEKSANAWVVTEPVRARANAFNVNALLRLLAAPVSVRFPTTGKDLADYGLAAPSVRVHFDDDVIALGAPHPIKNLVYVLYRNEIALIPGTQLGLAAHPYTYYIDTRLFEPDRRLSAIRLPDFSVRREQGAWKRQPADARLTSDRVNEFADEWANASALSAQKYSGKPALAHVEVTGERDGKQEKLELGVLSYKPNFILHRPDESLEYLFTEDTGRRLMRLAPDEN